MRDLTLAETLVVGWVVRLEDNHGRKLRRALVRNGHQRPDERTRPRPDDGTDRELPLQERGRGAAEGAGVRDIGKKSPAGSGARRAIQEVLASSHTA